MVRGAHADELLPAMACEHPIQAYGTGGDGKERCLWCGDIRDLRVLAGNVMKVYCHVTGSKVSKPMTCPDVVCALADEVCDASCEEAVKDALTPVPLPWVKRDWGCSDVTTPVGLYYKVGNTEQAGLLNPTNKGWRWYRGRVAMCEGTLTEEEAKAACQADFNASVLACLSPR